MKMVMVKYNEMKDMTNDVVKHYGNNEAALAYAEEVGEAYEDFLKTKSLMEFKELLINWMMKPNHDISADDARGGIKLVWGNYDLMGLGSIRGDLDQIVFEVKEAVKARKAAIAKMKKVVKKDEDINVDALKNTINNLRDRNAELIGVMYEKNNEIKDANNEIAILKKMLMDVKFEIENLKKTNDDLMIYKELVEDDHAEVA